ncbi:sulfatase [Halostella sp. PRR32]|uniref:sulfatase n=1 Tax=Halostella sp. PRR32 TaxID=3098147 RepID=UPI002B1D4745|nr:sulfatase [Halostella sp. PRR32]
MATPPNILWITLDSVRADHTTMGGYDRDTTPNLQRIADSESGEYLSNCFAAGNATALSAASILTGVYPSHHGLRIANESIPEELDTVAERLGDAGYATAGLSRNSYVSSGTGLDRGFDRFEWLAASTFLDVLGPETIAKYFLNIRSHSAGVTHDTAKHATPFLMNEVAKKWFTDLGGDEPFFFYLHYNEPHRPYYPPLPYLDRYTDGLNISAEEAADIAMRVHYDMEEIVADGYDLTETEQRAIEAMYDAEIAYTDEMVGRLFDHVQSLDLDDTVVVITADHGELFGERGMLAHRIVINDAVTHVPLVVHGLDDVDYPSDGLVQHLDLMRTLADMGGASTDGLQGIDMRQTVRERVISQRQGANFEPYLDRNPDFDTTQFHSDMLTSLRTSEFRYEKSEGRSRLFKLPDEITDVTTEHPDTASELDDALSEWLSTDGRLIATGEGSELTDAMQKQLQDLGYME